MRFSTRLMLCWTNTDADASPQLDMGINRQEGSRWTEQTTLRTYADFGHGYGIEHIIRTILFYFATEFNV